MFWGRAQPDLQHNLPHIPRPVLYIAVDCIMPGCAHHRAMHPNLALAAQQQAERTAQVRRAPNILAMGLPEGQDNRLQQRLRRGNCPQPDLAHGARLAQRLVTPGHCANEERGL